MTLLEWGPDQVKDLALLAEAALPDEQLTVEELLVTCWDDTGVVLATGDRSGAVAVVSRRRPEGVVAFVKLLVVRPEAQRRGVGTHLLEAATQWAWDTGAYALWLGGEVPFNVWPGVDVQATGMLLLADRLGFDQRVAVVTREVPTSFRAPAPDGIVLRRALDDADVAAVESLVLSVLPSAIDEVWRSIESATCTGAFVGNNEVVGLGCHSAGRTGWFGPVVVDSAWRHQGIARGLLGAACTDLMVAGVDRCVVQPVGTPSAFASVAPQVARTFLCYRLRRP